MSDEVILLMYTTVLHTNFEAEKLFKHFLLKKLLKHFPLIS